MTTPARVVCSLCWAIVGTYLASWFIVGTPNLIHLPWAGKACILVVGGIAWACIDKGWKDMRWDDQLNFADSKTKQNVRSAADALRKFGSVGVSAKGEWDLARAVFSQSPPKPAPKPVGGGYQPIGGSEATPPKDE